jgi:hypothetical protein
LIRRWREGGYRLSRRVPARAVVFDHVPKTGGTAINQALERLFSARQVAADRHVDAAAGNFQFAERYPIICGHFGGALRRRFQRETGRLTFTVIREPMARAVSTYSYWRHHVGPDHPGYALPMVRAARDLEFAAFIRSEDPLLRRNLFNTQFGHLEGGAKLSQDLEHQHRYAGRVEALAEEFEVFGTTEQLAETLQWLLREIGHPRPNARRLLERVPENRSPALDASQISAADRRYVMERNRLDQALHEIARRRLAQARQTRRTAFIGSARGELSRPSSAD